VSNVTWTVGHMTVRLGSGSIARVMAGSEPVGVYFKGSGTFEYVTVEAAELPVVDHNVKAVAHVKMTADATHATLSQDFTDVLILGGGLTMPEVTGSGGASLTESFAQHMALYDRMRATPASHSRAVQKFPSRRQNASWRSSAAAATTSCMTTTMSRIMTRACP
jgi:hypothetical protein